MLEKIIFKSKYYMRQTSAYNDKSVNSPKICNSYKYMHKVSEVKIYEGKYSRIQDINR
jgi:hypothetical protein